MYKYFSSKLKVVKLFGYDKYRSTLFYKFTINDMERKICEWEKSDIF